MEANKINLLRDFIGSSKRTFNIPVYQRNYDWKDGQCRRLFNDIEQIVESKYDIEHFLGTIVYVEGNSQPNFMELIVIDGQQRITSVMLLIKALIDIIQDDNLKTDIIETFLINRNAPERLRIKLKPIETDMQVYEKLLQENTIQNASSNIIKNFLLFKDLISTSKFTPEEIYHALYKLEIVYIKLHRDRKSENPQLIFESLNSTGLSLTPADLIRNYLLMNHDYEKQKRLYLEFWLKIEKLLPNVLITDFIRDYLTMKTGKIPIKEEVYISFKNYIIKNKQYDEEGILEELLVYAEYYSWLIYCNSPFKNINEELQQLQKLKSTVTYPVFLNVFEDCFIYKKINIEELCEVIKLIISYLFRRIISDYPTNALNKIFASMPKELEKAKQMELNYKDSVSYILCSKTGNGVFPRDDQFKSSFINKDLYKSKIDKYVLFELEKYESKETINLSEDITIEHIMPQKLTPAWQIALGNKFDEIHQEFLHTIGNLTLTGYNSELSNKAFDDKKTILIDSNISISRNLAKYNVWNETSIKKRAEELLDIAMKIWPIPEKYKNIAQGNQIEFDYDYAIMDDLNVTGLTPKQVTILDSVYDVRSWKDMLRIICSQMNELDNQLFESFTKHKDFEGKSRRFISDNAEGMNSPFKLTENIYIETTLNANAILNYCKMICEKYEVQNDVYYSIRR